MRLEFQSCVADVGSEFAVAIIMTDCQQQVGPPLNDEILHQRVGKHRAAWQQMQNIGTAIFSAQPIVRRGGVEDRDLCCFGETGDRQELRRRKIGDNETNPLRH